MLKRNSTSDFLSPLPFSDVRCWVLLRLLLFFALYLVLPVPLPTMSMVYFAVVVEFWYLWYSFSWWPLGTQWVFLVSLVSVPLTVAMVSKQKRQCHVSFSSIHILFLNGSVSIKWNILFARRSGAFFLSLLFSCVSFGRRREGQKSYRLKSLANLFIPNLFHAHWASLTDWPYHCSTHGPIIALVSSDFFSCGFWFFYLYWNHWILFPTGWFISS